MHQQQTAFENIVGEGEIACNEQFLLFPQCFLLNQIIVSPFVHIFNIISLFAAEFEESKIGISGKEFRVKLEMRRHEICCITPFQIHYLSHILCFTLPVQG